MLEDSGVDEPLRSAAIEILKSASRAREPELRAALAEAYATNLSQSELDAMVRWTHGDATPLSELDDAKLDKLELAIEATTEGFRQDARVRLCELVDCGAEVLAAADQAVPAK